MCSPFFIGVDFFHHFGLVVDTRRLCLTDAVIEISSKDKMSTIIFISPMMMDDVDDIPLFGLSEEHPLLIRPQPDFFAVTMEIFYQIPFGFKTIESLAFMCRL